MMRLLPFLVITACLTGCSKITWHVMRYESPARSGTGFASVQDSVDFGYTFMPDAHTIGIQVKNNGTGMMQLYPEKSLVVYNGMVQPWVPGTRLLQASVVTQSNPDPSLINTRSEITGAMEGGPRPYILPPGSYTMVTAPAAGLYTPSDSMYSNIAAEEFTENGFRYRLTTIRYAENQSPHKMVVYTAYSINEGPVHYKKDSFYLAEVNKCRKSADVWMQQQLATGRVFRTTTSKVTAAGALVGTAVIAGIIIGALNAPEN